MSAKDLLIIGLGPVGLYAKKIADNLNFSGDAIESTNFVGGQITNLYKEKVIKNLPAINKITGAELVNNLLKDVNVENSQIAINLKAVLTNLAITENHCQATFKNQTHYYQYILLCTGIGAYNPIRLWEKDFTNVFYNVENKENFANKNVVIFGGGDSAIDWALFLTQYAKSIKVVHRQDHFRADESKISECKKNKVEFINPFILKQEIIDNNQVKKLVLKNSSTEKIIELLPDVILVQYGTQISPLNLESINLNHQNHQIIVNEFMQTSNEKIYAAGDAIIYPTKVKNLLFGFQEAALALNIIDKKLHPNKKTNLMW